jgi:glutathione S-transferase
LVEYPDIESTLKAAGIPPTSQWPDGRPMYTLPAIVDDSTGAALPESFIIAEYLDKTYPDKPLLFPSGTTALQEAFADIVLANLDVLSEFALAKTCEVLLNSRSEEYFRRTKKELLGKTVDEFVPQGESAKVAWKTLEEGFGKIAQWMKDDQFVMGNTVSFADFVVTGRLRWAKLALEEDSQQW